MFITIYNRFLNKQYNRDECPICYEVIDDNKKNLLRCGHWCHFHCLIKSYSYSGVLKCPICRYKLNFGFNNNISSYFIFIYSLLIYTTIRLPETINSLYTILKLLRR